MDSPETFFVTMDARYGVSERFVEACRPLVETIYADFEGERRDELLAIAESVCAEQAETEARLQHSIEALQKASGQLRERFSAMLAALDRFEERLAAPEPSTAGLELQLRDPVADGVPPHLLN